MKPWITALLAVLAVLTGPVGQAVQLTAYDTGAQDVSAWRERLLQDGYTVRNTAATPLFLGEVAEPAKTVFLIIGMERSYGDRERSAINGFIERGGTVILADNGGPVPNTLARDYGVLYYGSRLRDAVFEFNQSFVRMAVPSLGVSPLAANPTALLCRTPACEEGVLARSSPDSFLDLNGNGVVDAGDDLGPFTLMVSLPVGKGRFVALPTPAMATNDLVQDPANDEFQRLLLTSVAPDATQVIFDESRHATPADERVWVAALTLLGGFSNVPLARLLLVLLIAAAVVLVARRGRAVAAWSHGFDLAVPVHEPRDESEVGARLAGLLRMKIKLEHQLVEPVPAETYLTHAGSDDARRLLQDPDHVRPPQALHVLAAHFPEHSQEASSHGGHALQASNTPSPPTEAPST